MPDRGEATVGAGGAPLGSHGWVVIMAGGGGTRFWPLSRRRSPKQFLAIAGDETLLRSTWRRALDLVEGPERVLVVTGSGHAELTREQLPDLGSDNLLLEPQARNTAPCIAWSAATLAARDPEAVVVVLPADHLIRDRSAFAVAVRTAGAAAHTERALVTFGVPPRYPETGYGYVEIGEELSIPGAAAETPVYQVAQFREKPDLPTAERYLEAGTFLWNSGIFVWRVDDILVALDEHLPGARQAAEHMVGASDDAVRAELYGQMPATSVDFGVMERAHNVATVRAPFDWSDVGSWAALCEVMPDDDAGNVCWGQVVAVDARSNLVHAPEDLVVLLGVEGLTVVRSGDVLLVASLDRSQDIRAVREKLKEMGLETYL